MNNPVVDIPIRDIHMPVSINWWPPAIGWWLVMGTVLLFALVIFIYIKLRKRRRFKRLAESEFNNMVSRYQQLADPGTYVGDLSRYLRQTAMHFYSREQVAGLTGQKWLQFLDETKIKPNSKKPSVVEFQSKVGDLLLTTPYNPDNPIDPEEVEQLTSLARLWVAALPTRRSSLNNQAG